MASSILTNSGAMTALRTLQTTNNNLLDTQNRISTGKKVATASDNAATWAVASAMNNTGGVFKTVADSLASSVETVAAFRTQSESVDKMLTEVAKKAAQMQTDGLDDTTKTNMKNAIAKDLEQIGEVLEKTKVNGMNLFTGQVGEEEGVTEVSFASGYSGTSVEVITIAAEQYNFDAGTLTNGDASATLSADDLGGEGTWDVDAFMTKLNDVQTSIRSTAAKLGSYESRMELQKGFMEGMSDALTKGVSALVDADMTEESARLQALQVQQQLGTQALSIANQAPQSLLSLFR